MSTAATVVARTSATLLERFRAVRRHTERLCEPLSAEDCLLQSMPDASPVKWHLAHSTWFFETFILQSEPAYVPVDPTYVYLFNSYYNAIGERHPRPQRGLLSRPNLADVYQYRREVDARVANLLERAIEDRLAEIGPLLTLGLHHEQQHQELILTDIQHALSLNPLKPAYACAPQRTTESPLAATWIDSPAGLQWIGHDGNGFAFDNESPRHRVWLEGFRLASRLVTCGEFQQFMDDGGYEQAQLWLSDGWSECQTQGWKSPLYWERNSTGDWRRFSLGGLIDVNPAEPVCHVSFYEADAFARWAGARLPTEQEWECAAASVPVAECGDEFVFAPRPAMPNDGELLQLDREVWQWTASPYVAYPGYVPAAGALGEYNGKFMCNQMVLRGGSCATPRSHLRRTYRNFFPPSARWQFSGIRLASDR